MERKNGTINCRGTALDLTTPVIMGIINITDDSFYAGGRSQHLDQVLEKAALHLREGAHILDIGAQSTRPGAVDVGAQVELERLLPAVETLVKYYPQVIISIDTYYAAVAEQTIKAGAAIINDISAGDMDPGMLATAAKLQVPYIAMHMQGTPDKMQQNPQYTEVVQDVLDYFIHKKAQCLAAGINDVIIDPGFGFGKTIAHNYALLKKLSVFHMLDCPLLVGISRKSMIYKLLDSTPVDVLNGTTVLNTLALQQGAAILRVHDVKAAAEVIRITEYMQKV
ncbi:dihydropteroate synthase [Chitinophaga oryziterrae]|uniref:dihydropteroate synthase n=1 Tax=Chitinophaga oryziterrae TaxID=1031224 RepID=A0A6N8JHE5_9BACT|nr:dihydropteroate synthase [Chitinophaga oryziterrae]MVT43891.1 dihydropteroate synthase [Chitinophaga oryziterrae]